MVVRVREFARDIFGWMGDIRRAVGGAFGELKRMIAELERETRAERPAKIDHKAIEARQAAVPDDLRIYAIGDVHGRADLLKRLMLNIREDAGDLEEGKRAVLVFLGDYVDRGFQSKEVIDYLLSEELEGFETIFLKGNHEAAFLEFMSDPAFGPQWAKFGGSETLTSYGIRPPRAHTAASDWNEACQRLNEVLPVSHRSFLQTLAPSVVIGDYAFVHAGMRPGRPIEEQTEDDLLWIRDSFLNDKTEFEQVVVHGHTPIPAPHRDHRRIGVDTGAYLSGKLTAARLDGTSVDFIST